MSYLRKGACHFQWPLMSEVKASCICDRRGWEPSGKAKLPDVFCHLFRLPEQAFVLVRLLRGLGVSDCICCGCSLPASSSSWHLKLARPALVYTWNAQATQPCESKLSVSQRRTLKRWPACWTELCFTPLLHWEWELEYMIYSLCVFYPFSLCIWECSFISPYSFSGKREMRRQQLEFMLQLFDFTFSLDLLCSHYYKVRVNQNIYWDLSMQIVMVLFVQVWGVSQISASLHSWMDVFCLLPEKSLNDKMSFNPHNTFYFNFFSVSMKTHQISKNGQKKQSHLNS